MRLVATAFQSLGSYLVKTLPSIAADNCVLSTPHITSPSGLPAVSRALVSMVPASPAVTTVTLIPVDAANSSSAVISGESFVGNESYATRVTGDGAPAGASEPHETNTSAARAANGTSFFMAPPR